MFEGFQLHEKDIEAHSHASSRQKMTSRGRINNSSNEAEPREEQTGRKINTMH